MVRHRWCAAGCAVVVALALLGCAKPSYRVTLELQHCGVTPLIIDGRTWELPQPVPVSSASTLPPDFSGAGTVTVESADRLTYVDDRGFELVFLPEEAVPPVLCL
jgi:hypothetical protein